MKRERKGRNEEGKGQRGELERERISEGGREGRKERERDHG